MNDRPPLEFQYQIEAETPYSRSLLENYPPEGPWELEGFTLSIDGSKLHAGTKAYYDEDEAKAALEDLVDRWTRRISLHESAYLVFRCECMTDNRHGKPVHRVKQSFQTRRIIVSPDQGPLPGPPDSPDLYVQTFMSETVERCVREIQDNGPLSAPVYCIRTAVEYVAHQCGIAVETLYNISNNVLEDMSNISSKRDPKHGRKVAGGGTVRGRNTSPDSDRLSHEEMDYLKKVGPAVGKRFLEVEYGLTAGPPINRSDLPTLPKTPKA